jgi:uncharacterized DUF497 family protein
MDDIPQEELLEGLEAKDPTPFETLGVDGFEWDAEKARQNEADHGVTFEEAQVAVEQAEWIGESFSVKGEIRRVLIGPSAWRNLFVVITIRGNRARIISARRHNA